MTQNPFVSESFTRIWSKHFNQSKAPEHFNFINDISFVKHTYLPYYINTGKNLTNGITYTLRDTNFHDYRGKVFLVRDLPSYLKIDEPEGASLKVEKIFQYPGFITKIPEYQDLDKYLKSIYKSNTRSKFRRNINRLEACFEVDYKMYFGSIIQQNFDSIFDNFYKLFEKRYKDKGEPCGELNPVLWNYYCELAFQMINEKTASLFVIYCNQKPVAITFSYHFDQTLIEALTVFDIDFYRYNLGHTMILKLLEWSFENDIKIFDYTQGDFEYKKRWSDTNYDTFYHVLYDSKSIKSTIMASGLHTYFNLKRIFRERKFNKIYHNLKFKLSSKKALNVDNNNSYKVYEESTMPELKIMELVDLKSQAYGFQRRALYDFLYMNPVSVKELEFYRTQDNKLYVKGEKLKLKIVKDDQ